MNSRLVRRRGVSWMAASGVLFALCAIAFHSMKSDPMSGDFDHTVAGIPRKLLPILAGAVLCGFVGVSAFVAGWRNKKDL